MTPRGRLRRALPPGAATDAKCRTILRHLHNFLAGQPLEVGPVQIVVRSGAAIHTRGSELIVLWGDLEMAIAPGEHSRFPQVQIGGRVSVPITPPPANVVRHRLEA